MNKAQSTYNKSHGKKNGNKAEMVTGGAGDWIIMPNGKFFDRRRGKWVIRCRHCNMSFYASRSDAKTCCNAHRTALHRKQAVNAL